MGHAGKGCGQGPARGRGNGTPRHILDLSAAAQAARGRLTAARWTPPRDRRGRFAPGTRARRSGTPAGPNA